ncbi:putative nucleoprotein [Oak-Vale virus]|uniref:Nucleoprotein n=1 Tax=Oak-Vale virus TaxID=318852 RepID=D8V088_9RHAB|nr:putative nucleoprotein [Oak-Vale virus]ADG86365.1 nucleoprotein N [Oak-Vale virus]AEJ07644.1 putative nucleoprotein [Oak-Vale virus]
MEIEVYDLESGRPIPKIDLEDRERGDFPAQFFQNGGRIRIQRVEHQLTPQQIFDGVWADVIHDRITVTGAKLFLQTLGTEIIEDTFDAEWTSFGVVLAPGGGAASGPFHAVEWVAGQETYTSTSGEPCQGQTLIYCAVYLCAIYRLGRSTAEGEYRGKLETTISEFLAAMIPDRPQLTGRGAIAGRWVQDRNFCRLVAMLDLFFREKKDHDYAVIRMGTIASRYRECTGLTSLTHLARLTGDPIERAICWVFQQDVARQVINLITPGQEITNFRGLTPYIADLGISRRSPYSSGINPEWHVFCHAIGVFMGNRRSIDARYLEAKDESTIMQNAGLVAYVCRHRTNLVQAFGSRSRVRTHRQNDVRVRGGGLNPFLDDDAILEEEADVGLPNVKDPEAWYDFLKMRNFQMPIEIVEYMRERATALTQTRTGSMGHKIFTVYAQQNVRRVQ